jgi:nitrate reductase gamma subunit
VSEGGIDVEVYGILKLVFGIVLVVATVYGIVKEIAWIRRRFKQ